MMNGMNDNIEIEHNNDRINTMSDVNEMPPEYIIETLKCEPDWNIFGETQFERLKTFNECSEQIRTAFFIGVSNNIKHEIHTYKNVIIDYDYNQSWKRGFIYINADDNTNDSYGLRIGVDGAVITKTMNIKNPVYNACCGTIQYHDSWLKTTIENEMNNYKQSLFD